ncbi:iron complex transport system permease [Enterococcus sp. DIV0755b]
MMKTRRLIIVWSLLIFLAFLILFFSLTNGAADISLTEISNAFFHFDSQKQSQQIIINLRLPRIIGAFLVGSAFALSGAVMQGVTRNPLADAGLLGINSGASLGLALVFIFFPKTSITATIWFSFGGAFLAAFLIFLVSRRSVASLTPTRLILAGVAISSLFTAISQALGLVFDLQQDIAFWFVGGVANITWQQLQQVWWLYLIAVGGLLFLAGGINLLILGDDNAMALGKKPERIRFVTLILVVFLAGIAVALVGPISFIGLMVPHVLRHFTGDNYRKLLPLVLVGGGFFVVLADLLARLLNPPFETPLGLLITIVGVPFLLFRIWRS